MSIFLETPRLTFRRFTGADEADLADLHGDPEVMRYITGERPTPRAEIRDRILPLLLGYYRRSESFGYWVAEHRATGRFLGWFMFRPPPPARAQRGRDRARVPPAQVGAGPGLRNRVALVRKGFTELGVERVVAEAMAVNHGSRRVLEKVGLTLVRTFHRQGLDDFDGAEHGLVEYALTRAEWQSAPPDTQ
jgi:RimJ/RimL family protein N-acetyltransferase